MPLITVLDCLLLPCGCLNYWYTCEGCYCGVVAQVAVTLWGSQAEQFQHTHQPVIAIKSALSSDFNGVSLSVGGSATMQVG